MDRSWMYEDLRTDLPFRRKVSSFVDRAAQHARSEGRTEIYCPCRDCKNQILWRDAVVIQSHLVRRGFVEGYTRWTKHGESPDEPEHIEADVQ